MSRLFRPEAVEHKNKRLHGTVVLAQTWSHTGLTLFFLAIVVGLLVFAFTHGFSRKETVQGMLVPDRGMLRLAAPQSGVIARIDAREGDVLHAGDPIFTLNSERTTAQGKTQTMIGEALSLRMENLREELEQHGLQSRNKDNEIAARLQNLTLSLRQQDSELATQRRKIDILREVSGNLNGLAAQGSVSRNMANLKAAELLEQEARVSALEGQRLTMLREIDTLTALRTDLPLQSNREASEIRRGVEELKQQSSETEARREVVVRAEAGGRLAAILVEQGQPVAAEQRLGSLLPADSVLEAELYVPTRAAGFVRPGTEVLLRYDAFPYQKFGQFQGRVREVSLTTVSAAELQAVRAVGHALSDEPVFRVRVRLAQQAAMANGQALTFKPGMQLSASLVLEHRTLMEWVLEPLLGISSRL